MKHKTKNLISNWCETPFLSSKIRQKRILKSPEHLLFFAKMRNFAIRRGGGGGTLKIVSQRQIVSEFILNIPLKKWFNFFAMMFLMNIYFSGKVCRMGARRVCLENYTWSVYHESRLVCLIFFFLGRKNEARYNKPPPPLPSQKNQIWVHVRHFKFPCLKKKAIPPRPVYRNIKPP